jgi:tryptophanyl-tRNA synthetase
MSRIFSGVQPTGNLHLGNYLGAIRNFVRLQDRNECIYCVVDLHAITVWQEPDELRRSIREVTAAFIACGVDPKRSVIFNQSQVPAHAELAWIFNCISRLGWLNRMTQFKEKAGKNRENASVGLYAYPNLMAADILAYKATHVPVGEDQKQHLELTRDIAQKFNNDFGREVFPLVEPVILPEAARVMSLRDGRVKMSKSDPSDQSRINLSDSADSIAHKIRRARTDPNPVPDGSQAGGTRSERPEAFNLLDIYAALDGRPLAEVQREFGGKPFSVFKEALTALAVDKIGPIGEELRRLRDDPGHVDSVLREGIVRARGLSEPVIREVHDVVGLLRP